MVDAKPAWIIQEAPALVIPAISYLWCDVPEVSGNLANRLLLLYLTFHYTNRTIIYPLRLRGGKPSPIGVVASAFFFCVVNGYMQGRFLTSIHAYDDSHLTSV
jgi:3-oxo-5-alpha-steroid 4-dehydrogenase 1